MQCARGWPRPATVLRCLVGGLGLLVCALPSAGTELPGRTGRAQATLSQEAEGCGSRGRCFRDRPLEQVLREFQARGVDLVFTSQLVRPEMVVLEEPSGRTVRDQLDHLLAAHGLKLSESSDGLLVVVARAPDARLRGRVISSESGEPVGRAEVSVASGSVTTQTLADGSFLLEGLEPSSADLEVKHEEFVPARQEGIRLISGEDVFVSLVLQPVPFLHDEIVVRPSETTLLQEVPARPLSLSRDELESIPHLGGDLFRAMTLLPGTAANDVTAELVVHGGRRDEVGIFLDGQELYDAYHLRDFDGALGVVASESLDGVRLSTAGFSVEHGDRNGAVLEMRTTTPAHPPRTLLGLSLLNGRAQSTGRTADGRTGWLLTGRRGSIELANRVFGREDPAFWDALAKVEWSVGRTQQIRLQGLRASDRLDFSEAIDGGEKRFETRYDTGTTWLTHQAGLGRSALVVSAVSWSKLDRDRSGAEVEDEQSFSLRDRRELEVSALRQRWSASLGPDHALDYGFEARRFDARYDYRQFAERDLEIDTPLRPGDDDRIEVLGRRVAEHQSAYLLDRWTPGDRWTVEVGLRFDRYPDRDESFWSPRMALGWRVGTGSVLRASLGRYVQSQRPHELLVEDGALRTFPAEESTHWIVGYEGAISWARAPWLQALRLEAYRKEVDNPRPRYENLFEPLNVFPEVEPDRVRLVPDRGQAYGVELFVRGRLARRGSWWVNYAWARAEERLDGRWVPRALDQRHTLNSKLSWRLGKFWDLTLAWRYHTGWPTTSVFLVDAESTDDSDDEAEPVPTLGPVNRGRVPDYHRLDARATREWELSRGRLTFYLDVQNLYDRRNLAGFDYSFDEDEGRLETDTEQWPGIFPSIGITWEF